MIQKTPLRLDINNLPDVIDLELTEDVYERCGEYCDTGGCAIAVRLVDAGLQHIRPKGGFWFSVGPGGVNFFDGSKQTGYSIQRVGEGPGFDPEHFHARWTGIIRLERI